MKLTLAPPPPDPEARTIELTYIDIADIVRLATATHLRRFKSA